MVISRWPLLRILRVFDVTAVIYYGRLNFMIQVCCHAACGTIFRRKQLLATAPAPLLNSYSKYFPSTLFQELKLSSDYLFLLRTQSIFDLVSGERIRSSGKLSYSDTSPLSPQLYLVTSTPITSFPYAFPDFSKRIELFVLPWVFPFVQVREYVLYRERA